MTLAEERGAWKELTRESEEAMNVTKPPPTSDRGEEEEDDDVKQTKDMDREREK